VRDSTAATSWSEGTLGSFPDGIAGATLSGGESSKKIAGSFDASAITTSPSSSAQPFCIAVELEFVDFALCLLRLAHRTVGRVG